MRLLHTTELRFQEFYSESLPDYAILSHRWIEGEEVSHQEFLAINRHEWAGGQVLTPLMVMNESKRDSTGFRKIMDFRALVATMYEWCWADPVCIDKTNSAELSEAINSMYDWYAAADACYVFLADVVKMESPTSDGLAGFGKSQWFQRGWTLQEVIAPRVVSFWDAEWQSLGTSDALQGHLHAITKIPGSFFVNNGGRSDSGSEYKMSNLSTADRMALAVGRRTGRIEDQAYSLLGLFSLNMPLMYGESNRAFRRLQEAIIQQGSTSSLFVHDGKSFLAGSVDDFRLHNQDKYLQRREVVLRVGPDIYRPRYNGVKGRGSILTWVKAVTNIGVEVQAAYLEVKLPTKKQSLGNEFRLIILDYASIQDVHMPVFVLVHRWSVNRKWYKIAVVEDQRCNHIRDDLAPEVLDPSFVQLEITKFRRQVDLGRRENLINHDLMYVT